MQHPKPGQKQTPPRVVSKKAHPNPTTSDVAHWMAEEIERSAILVQVEAVAEIRRRFGSEFLYISDVNEWSIDRRVLAEFSSLTDPGIVWVTDLRGGYSCPRAHWRFRRKGDRSGRTQYENL